MRLRVVEEAIDVFEPALRNVLEQVKLDDLVQLCVDVYSFTFEEDASEIILGQDSDNDLLRHDEASRISGLVCDQGILAEALASRQLIHMLHILNSD